MRTYACERDLCLAELFAARGVTFAPGPVTRCYSPFGGNSSSATTNEQPVATDTGRAQSGKNNKLMTDNAVDVSGNKGQIGGISAAGNEGNVTITTADPTVLADALARVADLSTMSTNTIANLAAQSSQDLSGAQSANQDQISSLLSELSTLATNQQTGGSFLQNRTVAAVVIAGLVVGGVYLWRKTK